MSKFTPGPAIDGQLRVWWIRNPPDEAFHFVVESAAEAQKILAAIAEYDIHCEVETNVGGLEVFRDGEWEEWESEDGDDIDHWASEAEADLLAACKALLNKAAHGADCGKVRPTEEWKKHRSMSFDSCQCEISAARAAIAKAEGTVPA